MLNFTCADLYSICISARLLSRYVCLFISLMFGMHLLPKLSANLELYKVILYAWNTYPVVARNILSLSIHTPKCTMLSENRIGKLTWRIHLNAWTRFIEWSNHVLSWCRFYLECSCSSMFQIWILIQDTPLWKLNLWRILLMKNFLEMSRFVLRGMSIYFPVSNRQSYCCLDSLHSMILNHYCWMIVDFDI